MNSLERRLPLWQAAALVVLGSAAAQLAGSFVFVWIGFASGPRAQLVGAAQISPRTFVPATAAIELTLIAVALIVPFSLGASAREMLGLRRAPPVVFAAAAIGTVMLGPLADLAMRAMEAMLPSLNLGMLALLNRMVRELSPFVAWPVFALLPGIAEELMFRGLLQNAAQDRRAGIAISALAFAAYHLDPHHIAGVLPLGFFLAWVASRCGTLVTIVAHVANNTFAIVAARSEALDVGYGTSEPMPWSWLPVSLLLALLAARVIAKNCPPIRASEAYSEAHDF